MNAEGIARFVVVWALLLLLPVATWAQTSATGTITGVVRDTSGAVLPGVTVEAASPVLIEKVRTVVTDGQGLYRIVDLRPGVYVVTFTLPGFSTFRREGLELTAGFTATVNAELKVGALEETVTVSGEAPVVDLQNVRQQTTLAREVLDAIPSTGRLSQFAQLIPAATLTNAATHSVGGLTERGEFSVHGAPTAQPVQDGMNQNLQGGAIFVFNNFTFQEVAIETSGMSAERDTGGVQINIIPKDGGNTFSGTFRTAHSSPDMQSANINDALRARGLRPTPALKISYDTGGAVGGPIRRNALWFFAAVRWAGIGQYQQGNYFNKLQDGSPGLPPGVSFYEADPDRPAHTRDFYRDYSLRLTWQVAGKHKIVSAFSIQPNCSCYMFLLEPQQGILAAPEATGQHHYNPNSLPSVNWTYPANNRLLIEAGASANIFTNTSKRQEGAGTDTIAITELSNNFRYGARGNQLGNVGGSYTTQLRRQYHQRVAVSYVTGSHNFKTGLDLHEYTLGADGIYRDPNQINGARDYTFRDRAPTMVRIWAVPFGTRDSARNLGGFAQDQWTIRKLTLNLGLRYNLFNASVPEQRLPEGPFVPARSYPAAKNVPNFTNLSPRVGAAYDLFGDGKTALKVSLGRYTPSATNATSNPAEQQAHSTTRQWNDSFYPVGDPRRGNYIPDCDLVNPATNGECGPWSDLAFGKPRASNTRNAEDSLAGFNVQPYNWQGSVSVQQELRRNMALNVGYFRTWYGGFLATDNLAVTPADYDQFCITAPTDARLPGGGGNQVCGLYDLKPALFGQVSNLVTQASHYGTRTQIFNGVDVTVNARFGRGGQFSGGLSTGRTATDRCEVLAELPEALLGATTANTLSPNAFCRVSPPWSAGTNVKFLVVYPLPWGLQTSAIYQNIPGIPITSTYVATNAEIRPSLGRNLGQCGALATCNATVTIDLIPPSTLFEDRLQQVDLRVTRIFRFGQARVQGNIDLYNMFNASNVLNMNTRYGRQWLNVVQIMGGRLVKFSGQIDF